MKKILFLFFWLVVFRGLAWGANFCKAQIGDSCRYNSTSGYEYENTCCSKDSNASLICSSSGKYELNYNCCDDQKCQKFYETGNIPAHVCAPIDMSCQQGEHKCDMSYRNDGIIGYKYFNCKPTGSGDGEWDVLHPDKTFVEELDRCNDIMNGDLRDVERIDLENECKENSGTWHETTNPLMCSYPSGYEYNYCEGKIEKTFEFPTQEITDFKFFYHKKDGNGEWKQGFDKGSENLNKIEIEDDHFPNSDFSQKGKNSDPNWKLKNSESLDSDNELLRNGTFKVAFSVKFKNENDYPITFKNIQIPFVVKKEHGFTLPLSKYEIKASGNSSFWIDEVDESKQKLQKEDEIADYENKKDCEDNKYSWDKDEQKCSFVFNCSGKIKCDQDIKYIVKVDSLEVDGTSDEKIEIQLYFVQESFWGENYQFNEPEIGLKYDYKYIDKRRQEQNIDGEEKILSTPKIILNNKPFNQFPDRQEEWWQAVGGGVYVKNLINNTPLQTDKNKNDNSNSALVTNLYLKNQDNGKFNAFSNCRYSVYNSLVTKNSTQYKNSCSPFLNTSLLKYHLPNKTVGPFGGFIMYGNGDPGSLYKDETINSKDYTNQLSERELTCLASDSVCNSDSGEKIDDDQFSLKLEEPLDVGTYQYYFNLAKSKHQDFYDLLNGGATTYTSNTKVPKGGEAVGLTTRGCKFVEFSLIDGSNQAQKNLLCYFDNVEIDASNPWEVDADYPITIFANSLTIKGNGSDNDVIPIKVKDESYLGFFIKNNITIDENVGSLNRQSDECLRKGYPAFFAGSKNNGNGVGDKVCYSKDFFTDEKEHLNGVFFTDEELIIESDNDQNSIDRKLNLKGIYIAKGGVDIERTYGNDAGKNIKHLNPIVRFIFNPDFNLTAPEWLKKSRKIYQEVN